MNKFGLMNHCGTFSIDQVMKKLFEGARASD